MLLRKHLRYKTLLLAGTMIGLAAPSYAQSGSLDEIVVTATKRAETVREIPMSIQAVDGDFLEEQSISNFEDLSQSIANFSVGESITTTNIVMRGLGSGSNRGFEQSVAMFIDGVYMPRSRQYIAPFLDVERVEVLRGPQAVLFGLNATAGSISVISAKTMPGDENFVEVSGEYEVEYGEQTGTAIAGLATDNIGLRLVYQGRGGGDGFFENTFSGRSEGAVTSDTYRGTVVWQPSDNFTMTGKVDHVDYKQSGTIGEVFGPGGTTFEPGDGELNWMRSTDANVLHLMFDRPAGQYLESTNYSLGWDIDMGGGDLSFQISHSDFQYELGVDLDNTSTNLGFALDSSLGEEYKQTSAELKWTSEASDKFEYVLGAYVQGTQNDQYNPAVFGFPDQSLGIFQFNEANIDSGLWSTYAIGTYHVNESFRITGGARYTDENKSYEGGTSGGAGCTLVSGGVVTDIPLFTNPGFGPLCPTPPPNTGTRVPQDRSSTNFMPEVALQYDVTEDIMLYAKVGTSAKAGGFTTNGRGFDDENVTGYEIGMKSRLLDGAAELNITGFVNDFNDLQVASFTNDTPPVSLVGNAASSSIKGVEIDGRWAATDWLILNTSAAYLDATYADFPRGPCAVGVAPTPCDLTGASLPLAPEWSGSIGANINMPISNGINLVGGPQLAFSSSYFTDGALNSVGQQDGWTKINARLGIEADDGQWSLAVVGKNLSDEVILNSSQPLAGRFLGYISDPRTITLQGKIKFGG